MVCRSEGGSEMILSHKEIEEIAVAVTKDFNEFFSVLIPMGRVCLAVRRLTSLPANISASMSLLLTCLPMEVSVG